MTNTTAGYEPVNRAVNKTGGGEEEGTVMVRGGRGSGHLGERREVPRVDLIPAELDRIDVFDLC